MSSPYCYPRRSTLLVLCSRNHKSLVEIYVNFSNKNLNHVSYRYVYIAISYKAALHRFTYESAVDCDSLNSE